LERIGRLFEVRFGKLLPVARQRDEWDPGSTEPAITLIDSAEAMLQKKTLSSRLPGFLTCGSQL
jgi:hypothetical protein